MLTFRGVIQNFLCSQTSISATESPMTPMSCTSLCFFTSSLIEMNWSSLFWFAKVVPRIYFVNKCTNFKSKPDENDVIKCKNSPFALSWLVKWHIFANLQDIYIHFFPKFSSIVLHPFPFYYQFLKIRISTSFIVFIVYNFYYTTLCMEDGMYFILYKYT